MRRALYISMILYFPLLLSSGSVLFGDFRADSPLSPLFQFLAVAWIVDGFVCMVAGIGTLRLLIMRALPEKKSYAFNYPVSIIGVLLGTLPAYILVDLLDKFIRLLAQ